MDINKLSFVISGSANEALKSLNELNKTLGDLTNSFKGMSHQIKSSTTSLNSNLTRGSSSINRFTMSFNNLNNSTKNSIGNIGRLARKIGQITILFYTLRNTYRKITHAIDEAISYTKSYNLFLTSLGENAREASLFLDDLSNSLMIDKSKAMRTMGLFYQISNSLGVISEKSLTLSKNLTKLAYDVSSFYAIGIEESITKLQSGLVGLSKPLRALGVDISENYLRDMAKKMGITKSLRQMSEQEKVQLRYNAILQQTINAQGDFVRRMDEAGNVVEIVKHQFSVLTRHVGEAFLPIIRKIGPEIIGLTVALSRLAKQWATVFGTPMKASPESITGQSNVLADNIDDTATKGKSFAWSMNNAVRAVRQMNSALTGIDELNILNEDTSEGFIPGLFSLKKADPIQAEIDIIMPDYDNLMSEADGRFNEVIEKWEAKIQGLIDVFSEVFAPLNDRLSDLRDTISSLGLFDEDEEHKGLKLALGGINTILSTMVLIIQDVIDVGEWLWEKVLTPILEFVAPDWLESFRTGTIAEKLDQLVTPLARIGEILLAMKVASSVLKFFSGMATFAMSPLGAWGLVAIGTIMGITGYPFSKEFVPYTFMGENTPTSDHVVELDDGSRIPIDLTKLNEKELTDLFTHFPIYAKDPEGEWHQASYIVSKNPKFVKEVALQLGLGITSLIGSGALVVASGGALTAPAIGTLGFGAGQTARAVSKLIEGGTHGVISIDDIEVVDPTNVNIISTKTSPILLEGVDAITSPAILPTESGDTYLSGVEADYLHALIDKAQIIVESEDNLEEDVGTFKKIGNFFKGLFNFDYKDILKEQGVQVPMFASGGRPAKGSLFIAGEAGPELVGNFNGQTEVINEQQMKSLGIPMYAGGTGGVFGFQLRDNEGKDLSKTEQFFGALTIGAKETWDKAKEELSGITKIIKDDFSKTFKTKEISLFFSNFRKELSGVGKVLASGIGSILGGGDFFRDKGEEEEKVGIWDSIKNKALDVWDTLKDTLPVKALKVGFGAMAALYPTMTAPKNRDIMSQRPEGGGVTDQQINLAQDTLKGMMGDWGWIIDIAQDINDGVVGEFLDNIPQMAEAGIEMLKGLINGLVKALPQLLAKIPEIITKVVDIITAPDTLKEIFTGLIYIVMSIVEALPSIISSLLNAIPTILTNVIDMFLSDPMMFVKMGWNLGISVLEGLANIIVEGLNFIISIAEIPVKWLGITFPRIPQISLDFLKMADGGFVPQGQMFIAREAGPELVGTMGGSTAVMNNEQIVESVARGVYEAVSQAMAEQARRDTVVNLDGRRVSSRMDRVQSRRGLSFGTGGF